MKIIADTTFLHGRSRFEKGGKYEGTGRVFGYFCMNGWAHEAPADDQGPFELVALDALTPDAPLPAPAQDEVTLQVQDVAIDLVTPHAE